MKPRAFNYVRATSIEDALAAYRGAEGERCYLAGGQSLIPSLSLRLQAPDLLIDISRIDSLRGISVSGEVLRIGALTRHADILKSPDVARYAPLLSLAAPHVAHPAIRNKGTIGGAIALADPSAEFPAMTLALDAQFEIVGANGLRRVKADGFFRGLFETGLEPGQVLTAVLIPCFGENDYCAFDELARRRGDYALVGAGVQARFDGDRIEQPRIAFFSVGSTPQRVPHVEKVIAGQPLSPNVIAGAQAAIESDIAPEDDGETSTAMRLHLARVLLGRLLARLGAQDRLSREAST